MYHYEESIKTAARTPSETDIYAYLISSVSRECIKVNMALIAILCTLIFVI